MCGRFTVTCDADGLRAEFGVDVPVEWVPRYNVAPQQPVPVIGRTGDGPPTLSLVRWGLVPWWADTPDVGVKAINARAETIDVRPTFREAFRERRCWIVADGFYEWRREGRVRQPWRFALRDRRPFAFAGLWDRWKGPDGEPLFTCAIVTTAAHPTVAAVHDRMPVMLARETRDLWLDDAAGADALKALLRPWPRDDLEGYAVTRRVNSVLNDEPACIEPWVEDQTSMFRERS